MILLGYRRDGARFWNELTLLPVPDEEGRIWMVGLHHDVTNLHEMRDEIARTRTTIRRGSRPMASGTA